MSANRTIAKNTIMLYIRMLLSMAVSLYTTRIVLQTLGVEDYGTYGVVGGVVMLFSFLNASMSGATSRFITYSLGKGDKDEVKEYFSTAVIIHFFIALTVIVLAETIGLWFLENKLVIPEGRMNAARVVYQFSILTMAVQITQVPYNASIISYEKMDIYAYVEILNVLLKLGIVYLLLLFDFDKLILYSALVFAVQLIVAMTYRIYCVRKFDTCHFQWIFKKEKFIPMLSFSGWDLYGNMCHSLNHRGISFLINMFFGVIYNAASSVASSVKGIVENLSSNIIQAFRPQIVKSYAAGNLSRMEILMGMGLKFSLLLLMFLAVPIVLEMDTILHIWLGSVPECASLFCRLLFMVSFFNLVNRILSIGISATGNIKKISIITGTIQLLGLPVVYVAFKYFHLPQQYAYIITIIMMMVVDCSNLLILKLQIPNIKIHYLVKEILISILIVCCAVPFVFPAKFYIENNVLRLLGICFSFWAALIFFVYFVALNKKQRSWIANYIVSLSKQFRRVK